MISDNLKREIKIFSVALILCIMYVSIGLLMGSPQIREYAYAILINQKSEDGNQSINNPLGSFSRGYNSPNSLDPSLVELSKNSTDFTIKIHKPLKISAISCNSNSMGSSFNCNSTVITESIDSDSKINPGDIIAYYSSERNKTIIHEVMRYDQSNNCYIFMGLNNFGEDPECIKQSNMLERVVAILPTSSTIKSVKNQE